MIFTKRNALVGFLVLTAGRRARSRMVRRTRKWSAWRIAAVLVLGVVSVGVLAAVAGVVHRRQREQLASEGGVTPVEVEAEATSAGIAGSSEPIPAT